jgi:hypothetical protein
VNPTWDTYELIINADGVEPAGKAKTWVITGDNPLAYNEPGRPRNVSMAPADPADLAKEVTIRPLSITLLKAPVR